MSSAVIFPQHAKSYVWVRWMIVSIYDDLMLFVYIYGPSNHMLHIYVLLIGPFNLNLNAR